MSQRIGPLDGPMFSRAHLLRTSTRFICKRSHSLVERLYRGQTLIRKWTACVKWNQSRGTRIVDNGDPLISLIVDYVATTQSIPTELSC